MQLPFVLVSLIAILILNFDLSQSQSSDCSCGDFCSEVQGHDFIIQGQVAKVQEEKGVLKYKVVVKNVLKGNTSKTITVFADESDDCLMKLEKKESYLLFLVQEQKEFWLSSSCRNDEWTSEYKQRVSTCLKCPVMKCMPCPDGYLLDENGCTTCQCLECPEGKEPVFCFIQPCAAPMPECDQEVHSCVDDYCGGCFAHYFDKQGNEICKNCPDLMCGLFCENGFKLDENGCEKCECNECPDVMCTLFCENGFKTDEKGCEKCECNECPTVTCDMFCENGFKTDEKGCEKCECNECPPVTCDMFCENGFKKDRNGCELCECNACPEGVHQVQCLVEPCSVPKSKCKEEVASCVNDYCGGCFAHWFDKHGNEICKCPEVNCALFCENGFEKDKNGCDKCKCKAN